MKYTLRDNGVIINIVEGPDGYVHPSYDTQAYQAGESIPVPVSTKTHETMVYPDEFMALFLDAEYAAAPVRLKDELMAAAGRKIDVQHPRVVAGVQSMSLSQEREDAILAGVVL